MGYAPFFRLCFSSWLFVSFALLGVTCQTEYTTLCYMMQDCNGHGTCLSDTRVCTCQSGWGAEDDISTYKAPDCSLRVCPAGASWVDVPTDVDTAHSREECSNAGLCNRATGKCACFDGYTGSACQRATCPNDCSGHGTCISMREIAQMSNALPLQDAVTYAGSELTTTWDEDRIFSCVCDSSWTVGLADGETQEPEWFGPDCSQKHCPTGDDPTTDADETDCSSVLAEGGLGTGASGNLCHIDCAKRGICTYSTGVCTCFDGAYGANCASLTPYN